MFIFLNEAPGLPAASKGFKGDSGDSDDDGGGDYQGDNQQDAAGD